MAHNARREREDDDMAWFDNCPYKFRRMHWTYEEPALQEQDQQLPAPPAFQQEQQAVQQDAGQDLHAPADRQHDEDADANDMDVEMDQTN